MIKVSLFIFTYLSIFYIHIYLYLSIHNTSIHTVVHTIYLLDEEESKQREMIAEAFVNDDVLEDFAKEKAAIAEANAPKEYSILTIDKHL